MTELIRSLSVGSSEVTILGTAHVSRTSAETVKQLISSEKFDVVCIELCQSRYNSMMKPGLLAEMDLFDVIRRGKASTVTANLALGAYQQRMAEQLDVELGVEMKTAITEAGDLKLPIVLIDREIGTTLKRVYRNVPFWKRIYLIAGLVASVFTREEVSEDEVERLKSGDILETTFAQFSEGATKELFAPLIDERDQYMTAKILETVGTHEGKRILVVVGAGHVKGMSHYLGKEDLDYRATIAKLERLPKGKSWLKAVPWVIVALICTGFYLGFRTSPELGWSLVFQWVVINGTLSALGAAVVGAHILTVLTAFVAAPVTSLNPTIGAGMVTAAVELFVRKPLVRDFEQLRKDTATASGWLKNSASRTLLIFLMSSLGSAIGTYVAGFRIFEQLT